MENISTLAIIITVLLTLITMIMTTVSVQLYRITDTMKRISDRLLIVETEHKNRKTNCSADDDNIHDDLKKLIQDLRIYEKLKDK
jgi:hypothetical protein